ncbi:hypothetical protein EAH76_22370 [Sphingomonas glacialis]|uniref:DUF2946 domain-containing protein n=2 Tax=Sphingomonas glacialis TaxID=658225 RepID=A0A502FCU4_9SPHN|nr:hypothetical protein EAH76_22370 [Sphingomonas glacialis]
MLRRLWSLLLVMIASSLVMSATVHAREIPGPMTIECSGTVHSDDDADQSPGDADNAISHHHGTCHGASLDVPATEALPMLVRADSLRAVSAPDSAPASRAIDPALRPPAAA